MTRTALAWTVVLLAVAWLPAATQDRQVLFEKALALEEAQGKLKDALALFQKIVDESSGDQALAAQAQLRIGICHLKLGHDEAQDAFQKVIDNYPGQSEAVRQAREQLSQLLRARTGIGKGDGGLRIRRVPELRPGNVSRDGRWIGGMDDDGNLAVVAVGTGSKHVLTRTASWDKGDFVDVTRISPDSRRVAFSWIRNSTTIDLRVVNMDGTGERTLVSGEGASPSARAEIWPLDWTADGLFIVGAAGPDLRRNKGASSRIVRVSVSDGAIHLVKDLGPSRPDGLEVSPDGRWIAYDLKVNPDTQNTSDVFLLSLDGSSHTPLTKHPAEDRLLGWTPDGAHVLFASNRSGTWDAWIVRVEQGKAGGEPALVKRDFGSVSPMGVTRDGSFYCAVRQVLSDVYVAVVDPESGKVLTPPERIVQRFEGNNEYPAWSPDGKHLAYIRRASLTPASETDLCLLSVDTGDYREVHPKLGRMVRTSWLPNGEHVLVVSKGIHSVNVKTAAVRTLVTDGWGFHSPRCTPDGESVLYEDDTREEAQVFRVMSYDVESGTTKEVYRSSQQIIRMDISPDGRWVAFLEPADAALKVMPPQGGQPRVLHRFDLDKGIWSTSVAWSPDGKYIYFTKGGGGKLGSFDLWRIPSAGGEAVRLDVAAPGMENLDVHPDGRRIAFNSTEVRREVWVMENFLPVAKEAPAASAQKVKK